MSGQKEVMRGRQGSEKGRKGPLSPFHQDRPGRNYRLLGKSQVRGATPRSEIKGKREVVGVDVDFFFFFESLQVATTEVPYLMDAAEATSKASEQATWLLPPKGSWNQHFCFRAAPAA